MAHERLAEPRITIVSQISLLFQILMVVYKVFQFDLNTFRKIYFLKLKRTIRLSVMLAKLSGSNKIAVFKFHRNIDIINCLKGPEFEVCTKLFTNKLKYTEINIEMSLR